MSAPSSLLVYYDTETTGLDMDKSEIVELAACLERTRWWSALIKPTNGVPPEITKFNGISDETVKDAGSFSDSIPLFFAWLDEHRREATVVLVAHNNFEFDMLLLKRQCKESQIDIPSWIRFADTLPAFRSCFGYRSNTLASLAKRFKVTGVQSHRARADVDMLMQVVDKCGGKSVLLEEMMANLRE